MIGTIDAYHQKNVVKFEKKVFAPKKYEGREYVKLQEGDYVTFDSCVYSTYPAKDKFGKTATYRIGNNEFPFTKTTIYFGLTDGRYTSLRNDVVAFQMQSLTNHKHTMGEVEYNFPAETVKVIKTKESYGTGENKKEFDVLAFEQ